MNGRNFGSKCLYMIVAGMSLFSPAEASKNKAEYDRVKAKNIRDFSADSDEVLLARMLFGEARGECDLEMVAVAHTAVTRANDNKEYNGSTLREAILFPYQYSCFNGDDANREKLRNPMKYDPKAFERCLRISREVLSGKHKDPTNGATHYHTHNIRPEWFGKMKKIGRIECENGSLSKHYFHREK